MKLKVYQGIFFAAFLTFFFLATNFEASEKRFDNRGVQYRQRSGNQLQEQGPRDYFKPLSPQEETDIRYLINTLANNTAINLLLHKRSLDQAGNRIAHVHPLKFFLFVFADSQLKYSIKRIKGIAWRRFVKGMAGSFNTAYIKGDMREEYVDDFSEKVGVPKNSIEPLIQKQDWAQFINKVRAQIQ
jgi:hypothetical protein